MTSNLGTADLRKANLGFGKADEAITYERMKEKVNDALKQHFRPEFLNRIDETIVFHELSKDEVTQIVDLLIARTAEAARGPGHRHRAHAGRQELRRRQGLRPHPRRPTAAPGHPAAHRGRAVREAPPQGVPRRADRRRRRRGRTRRPTSWSSPSRASRASSPRRSSWRRPAPPRRELVSRRFGGAGRVVGHVGVVDPVRGDPWHHQAPVRAEGRPLRRRPAGPHRRRTTSAALRDADRFRFANHLAGVDRGGGRPHRRPRPERRRAS